jgi:hypothetical protein
MKIGPEEETWTGRMRAPLAGDSALHKEVERLKGIVFWNRCSVALLGLLLMWLMWEVYDIWPDTDADDDHAHTIGHFIKDNAQVTMAFIGLMGVVFTSVMQAVWHRKK